MSAPKPGDRVRGWVEGTVSHPSGKLLNWDDGGGIALARLHDVEVLTSPVYANSDTTEHREGDVVRGVVDGEVTLWCHHGFDFTHRPWFRLVGCNYFARNELPDELTLLIRDNKPVPQ